MIKSLSRATTMIWLVPAEWQSSREICEVFRLRGVCAQFVSDLKMSFYRPERLNVTDATHPLNELRQIKAVK
ncbi:hypothetical protein D3C80_194380 [compost metagenome]